MGRLRAVCLMAVLPAGCMTGPLQDNPTLVPGDVAAVPCENPVLLYPNRPPGEAYAELFDRVLDVVDDYFPIAYANRYEGRVLGRPTVAPGYEQPWRPGSPDKYERTLATLQAYRYRCEVRIREADPAGYFVQVTVRKELKDYPTPSGSFTAIPVFGDAGSVDRDEFVVVDPDITSPLVDPNERWIPKGRETALEQAIIQKLRAGQ
jgi:hypothetical protein